MRRRRSGARPRPRVRDHERGVHDVTTIVAKLGGNALELLDDALRARAAAGPAARLCLVHGGGAQISALMRRRGIEPRFVGGRRATDLPTLACVRQALAGVSDGLVEALAARGETAEPLRQGECLRGRRLVELGLVRRDRGGRSRAARGSLGSGPPAARRAARDGRRRALPQLQRGRRRGGGRHRARRRRARLPLGRPRRPRRGRRRDPDPALGRAPPTVGGGMVVKLEACGAALAGGVGRVRIGAGTEVTA